MTSKNFPIPKIGDKIYVPGSMYVYRGMDDFAGGLATISNVKVDPYGFGPGHPNYCFVSIEERPGHEYNWGGLYEMQDELKDRLGDQVAHPDPDLRPEFNDSEGDWVQF